MEVTAAQLAKRWVGVRERKGDAINPAIAFMLELVGVKGDDAIAWCSAFVNFVAWQLGLRRSGSAHARSWLMVGEPVELDHAQVGFDVVVFNRGGDPRPVVPGPGHVAFYAGRNGDMVHVIGGNQGDGVSIASFPAHDVLGVRRLAVV